MGRTTRPAAAARTTRTLAAACGGLLALALAACGPGPGDPPAPTPTPTPSPMPSAVAQAVSVEIYQARLDWVKRVVSLRVHNGSDQRLTVASARLSVPGFDGDATSDRSRRVPAGLSGDVKVPLGAPVCSGGAPPAARTTRAPEGTRAEVALADERGRTATVRVSVDDPTGNLARIHAEDCAAALVATGATLTLDPELTTEQAGDELRATVRLRVEPVPGGPPVEVHAVDRTIIFAPPDQGPSWPADVRAGTATVVDLVGVAPRCDPHAVAEDKRGTFLGVHASVDGVEQHVFYLTSPPALQGAIYAFIADACGWPEQ